MATTDTPRYDHAVVVCTRNRPEDVRRLMESLRRQTCSSPFLVVVVDASDAEEAVRTRAAAKSEPGLEVKYVSYVDTPSLARQRNFGIDHLPESVAIVHFLDDDVSLEPGYLETLTSILQQNPEIGGIGGRVLDSRAPRVENRWKRMVSRMFLLESGTPGRVLPSGGLTSAQSMSLDAPIEVESLGGCVSYRREIVGRLRFDEQLEGYSMDEDLDLSYRVGREAKLVVEPEARLVHHVSLTGRHSVRESRRDLLVHRYWFVEKNIRHPLRKPAFWWRTLGSYLMLSMSRNPEAKEARKGMVEGVSIILKRSDPLL